MPSYHEGLGLSAIEAVATGLPLVCSDVQGLKDVAAEMKSAVLTSTSAASVADAIVQLLSITAGQRRRNAMEDSVRIRERFSARNGVRSITDGLYHARSAALPTPQQECIPS